MSVIDLLRVAAQPDLAWRSTRVAGIGGANLKLTRMDAQAYRTGRTTTPKACWCRTANCTWSWRASR